MLSHRKLPSLPSRSEEYRRLETLSLSKAEKLTEEINDYAYHHYSHWDAQRLQEALVNVKTKLNDSSRVERIPFKLFLDLLAEANSLPDIELLNHVVDFVVLDLGKLRWDGSLILERVTTRLLDNILKSLIDNHFESVAVGNFTWLLDIQETGYTTSVIDMVQQSVRAGPWLMGYDRDNYSLAQGVDAEQLETDYHQLNCVHKGGNRNHQLQSLIAEPPKTSKDTCNHEQMRRKVLILCGLAGILPSWMPGKGRIEVQRNDKVSLYMYKENSKGLEDTPGPKQEQFLEGHFAEPLFESSMTKANRDPSRPLHRALSIPPKKAASLDQFSDAHAKQIDLLEDAMTRFCRAAAVLQTCQYCCSSFTVMISRDTSDSLSRRVDMESIGFEKLNNFRGALSDLQTQMQVSTDWTENIETCSAIAEDILSIFLMPSQKISGMLNTSGMLHYSVQDQTSVNCHLHICSLATQLLGLGLVLYTQGHLGPLSSPLLAHDLTEINLLGIGDENFSINASLREFSCLAEMVGGPVFVFRLMSASNNSMEHQSSPGETVDFRGRGVDLLDTWGPGLVISETGAPYGQEVHAIEIGGGVIRPVDWKPTLDIYHWSSCHNSYHDMRAFPTFSLWNEITIGAISIQTACPLDPEKCRRNSQQFLCNLGTRRDYWELAQRQVAFQAGYYSVFQVGNLYARKLGRTVKQQIVEQWSLFPNLRTLVVPWGLQVSLCTGIAKRVSLRKLIEDSMFGHVDTLKHQQWHKMLPNARAAFQGSVDLKSWVEKLSNDEKICLIAIIAHILDLLENTGVDRKGEYLSVLWPDASSPSYGVKVKCNDTNAWRYLLQDSESCATFAAMTSSCLEGHNHTCRNMAAPSWQDRGGLLATAVCRDLSTERATAHTAMHLQLESGQRYWIGKVGGAYFVVVREMKDGDVHLIVKCNRFPKVLSQSFWRSNVIRERPDVSFNAVDVLVLGDIPSI